MSLSKTECYEIIHNSGMLENIIYHSFKVSHLAEIITEYLINAGIDIDPFCIKRSALLHDITKTRSLNTKELHAETGCQFLKELGYRKEADIVRQHVTLDSYIVTGSPTAEEIVNYSDKRVLHDEIVHLEKRMAYIMERYGDSEEKKAKIKIGWENTRRLEAKIFNFLPFKPSELIVKTGDDGSAEYFEYIAKRDVYCSNY